MGECWNARAKIRLKKLLVSNPLQNRIQFCSRLGTCQSYPHHLFHLPKAECPPSNMQTLSGEAAPWNYVFYDRWLLRPSCLCCEMADPEL